MLLHQTRWKRRGQPVLSAMTTRQNWCRVVLYNPSVLFHEGRYRMWYVGNSSRTRVQDTAIGYAESEDGIDWAAYPGNPILAPDRLPFGSGWQTPRVLFDDEEGVFKMWFVASSGRTEGNRAVDIVQQLGYATSRDGLDWTIHPEPILLAGRGPCVIKDGPGQYRMWMNAPSREGGDFQNLVSNIYRFTSEDGIHWQRDAQPAVTVDDGVRSVVYPYVLQIAESYTMWYGCHVESGFFEIYCSTSSGGLRWQHHRDRPAFPATRNPNDFDGRYTSTPCVLSLGDEYRLYYSARDMGNLYGSGDGCVRADGAGVYRHIGVAQGMPRRKHERASI